MPAAAQALDSIICQGSILSGGQVERSIVGPNVRVNSYSHVEDSILLEGVDIGRHCQRPPRDHRQGGPHPARHRTSASIMEHDRARGFTVSEGGVVVIAKADGVDHFQEELESIERLKRHAVSQPRTAHRPAAGSRLWAAIAAVAA